MKFATCYNRRVVELTEWHLYALRAALLTPALAVTAAAGCAWRVGRAQVVGGWPWRWRGGVALARGCGVSAGVWRGSVMVAEAGGFGES